MSTTAVNPGTVRGAKDKKGYSSLNLSYKTGARGGESKGYGMSGDKGANCICGCGNEGVMVTL